MLLTVNASNGKYDVIIEKHCLSNAYKYLNLKRKILIVSDDGVPTNYIETLKKQCENPYVYIIKQGEESKNIDNYQKILSFMVDHSFTRSDAVIALGGGVVGDLSGFVSATYMRGIDFYNIPTTLLSQVDSSIGGKTAIDFNGIKNIVGAFYQPKMVLIDSSTLLTLDERQLYAGLVEAIKMAATSNEKLFELIENSNNLFDDIDEIIYQSLLIKKDVVEKDALEKGLRKILNYGHSIGHAIESNMNLKLLHGECVALGMIYMSSENVKKRLINLFNKYHIQSKIDIDKNQIIDLIKHDKKASNDMIDIIFVDSIGSFNIIKCKIDDIKNYL